MKFKVESSKSAVYNSRGGEENFRYFGVGEKSLRTPAGQREHSPRSTAEAVFEDTMFENTVFEDMVFENTVFEDTVFENTKSATRDGLGTHRLPQGRRQRKRTHLPDRLSARRRKRR